MKIDQNPFSIYDFLGYLLPGLFFIYGGLLIVQVDLDNFQIENLKPVSLNIDQYFIIVILSYIIGHILSYFSSVSVEIYSIWSLDYPSRYLLNLANSSVSQRLLNDKRPLKIILKIFMMLFIFPVVICDFFIRKCFKTGKLLGKSIDPLTIDVIKMKIGKYVIKDLEVDEKHFPLQKDGTDFFNLVYHHILEKAHYHNSKMQNYVALYGFTRTICFSFICLMWIAILNGIGGTFSLKALLLILVLISFAMILYLDFNKFFRKFSLEVLMDFTTFSNEKEDK